MAKRVLLIGGYGNFGSYIARQLASDPAIELIIAGRSEENATALIDTLSAHNPARAVALDIYENLDQVLAAIKPHITIHTSGPFQGQNHFVANACIAAQCHYIDLADGRDFVAGIGALDERAVQQGVSVISGASSVPGLSSAIIDKYLPAFSALYDVEYGITTAQKTNRGLATTAAILSYTGKPFETLREGQIVPVYGWQGLRRQKFPALGQRFLANCNVPDLALFPRRYPTLRNLRFYAGLEIPLLHFGLWGLSWLVRLRFIKSLEPWAAFLLKRSFMFDRFGSDTSAFFMVLRGLDPSGTQKEIAFNLTARSGDGPYIPCMPAILLTKQLANGEAVARGAAPCMGFLSLDEYLAGLAPMDITWSVNGA